MRTKCVDLSTHNLEGQTFAFPFFLGLTGNRCSCLKNPEMFSLFALHYFSRSTIIWNREKRKNVDRDGRGD